ncbi:hypothetical protein [Vibrio europaeus]|uniref:hypothetical protein n=1 Tax=Vibrio europaeus TaxID=300876 RepID=UPI00148CE40E|nr:hypothetical protein [Vibrio europaeus]MDC5854528.1 hypothetical protein [Vibrio europaeus]NOH24337.1 hypothetical protein [Vibrio europaeus]
MILEGHVPDKEMIINDIRYYIFKRPDNVKRAWQHLEQNGFTVSGEHNYYFVESTCGVHRDLIPLASGDVVSGKARPLPKQVVEWCQDAMAKTKLHLEAPEMAEPRFSKEGMLGGLMYELDDELFSKDPETRKERLKVHQQAIIDKNISVQLEI